MRPLVVIPTYNECGRLGVLLERIFDACDREGLAIEVVVVDDNSADGTGDLADEWARSRRVRSWRRWGSRARISPSTPISIRWVLAP